MQKIIMQFKKGHIPWNKGKHEIYSEEVLKKMSLGHKGIVPKTVFKKGHISWLKGTKGLVVGFWKGKTKPYPKR
mgnify:CR=1 FL=1